MTDSKRSLRILTHHETLPTYLKRYAAMAEQHGWDVAVDSAPTTATPAEPESSTPVPRAYAGRSRHPLAMYAWDQYFDTFAPFLAEVGDAPSQVYVVGDLPSLPVAAWCAQRHGGYLVYAPDELAADAPERNPNEAASWSRLEQYLLTFCDAVWTPSEALSHAVAERYALPQPRLSYPRTILSVPPAEGGHTSLREALDLSETACVIAVPGPLEAERGLLDVVETLPHLPTEVVVVFAGSGPLHNALEEKAAHLHVSERVRVWPEATPAGLYGADLALVPDPALSMADWLRVPEGLLWARQAGLPVIAQDTAGVNTVLTIETAGMPAALDSSAAITHVIAYAYQADRAEWREQASAAQAAYGWTAQVQQLSDGLDQLLRAFPKAAYQEVLEAAYVDLDARDAAAAEEKLRVCLELDPTHPDALALATTLALAQFDLKKAQHYQVQTLSQDPQHVIAQRRGRQIRTLTNNLKLILSAA